MVPAMKLPKLYVANLSRAVIVAFAAQVVAGAMCLMPASAVEATQASGTSTCVMQHIHHERHACPHCDAPVQAVSQIDISHGLQAPMPLAILPTPLPEPVAVTHVAVVTVPRILAPPDSASLILRISQRVRI